jgi:hypothetical protein
LGGGGGCDHECEDEQYADDLDRLGGGEGEQQEDRDADRADRDAACFGHLRVDAREKQRPIDSDEAGEDDGGDESQCAQLCVVDADDASEEQIGRFCCVALVQREQQDADSEAEGEHGPDRAVALATA